MKKALVSLALGASLSISAGMSTVLGVQAAQAASGYLAQTQGSGPEFEQIQRLGKDAQAALDAGDLPRASRLAQERLKRSTDKKSWNYGNVVYEANHILGLAALRQGDVAKAKTYLLAAGSTPGSPQLNSFGPDLSLAQELINKGETQTVHDFLSLIRKFWAIPRSGTQARFIGLYTMHGALIDKWQAELKAGRKPTLNRYDVAPSRAGGSAGTPDQATGAPKAERPALLAAGTAAPDFRAVDTAGKTVRLSDYRGKVVVLDFWASWCPPCVASMPHNQAVTKKLQKAGVPVVLLALDNSEERPPFLAWVRRHRKLSALVFAHASPKTSRIASDLYHVTGIPTQYVIDKNGIIRTSFVGFGGPTDALETAIRAANTSASATAK